MAILSAAQVRQYAANAGFSGRGLDTIVAIAQAESSFNTTATNHNTNGSIDRGLYQINSVHGDVSVACAFDPACASAAVYKISSNGKNFTPWTTFNLGTYARQSSWLQSASGGGGGGNTLAYVTSQVTWSQARAKTLWPWLFQKALKSESAGGMISQYWDGHNETGVDLAMPTGVTITSLTAGTVLAVFYYGGGGVVSIESQLRGIGVASTYYQHLDLINTAVAIVGKAVKVGDVVGWSGGQLHGGHHPATCCSSGPHIEVGYNNPIAMWKPLGKNGNPLPWIQDLIANGPPASDIASSSSGTANELLSATNQVAHGTGPVADDFTAVESAIDNAMQFQGLHDDGTLWGIPAFVINNTEAGSLRLMVVLLGLLIVTAFIFNLIKGPVADATLLAASAGGA